MMRSIFAVVAGYVVLVITANLAALLSFTVIGPSLPAGSGVPFLWANALSMSVVFRSIAATLGGYVTAMLARKHPIVHALVLGGMILLIDLGIASVMPGNQPPWYPPLMSGAGAGLAVFGGCLARGHDGRPATRETLTSNRS